MNVIAPEPWMHTSGKSLPSVSQPKASSSFYESGGYSWQDDGTMTSSSCGCGAGRGRSSKGGCGCGCSGSRNLPFEAASESIPLVTAGPANAPGGSNQGGNSSSSKYPGVSVEPGKDNKGKNDPCKSIITLYLAIDEAASIKKGCPQDEGRFLSRGVGSLGIDLSLLNDAIDVLEGKTFKCPCKTPSKKACSIQIKIELVGTAALAEIEGQPFTPVVLDCSCNPKEFGDYDHETHRLKVCWPIRNESPHIVLHEVMHALGITYDSYIRNAETGFAIPMPGWKGAVMGDPEGLDIKLKDVCAIAKAQNACKGTAVQGKKVDCCPDGMTTDFGKDEARPAIVTQVPAFRMWYIVSDPEPARRRMYAAQLDTMVNRAWL